jgi:ribulose-bisphosphate carboxylase large chain
VRSLRDAWAAAVEGEPLAEAARRRAGDGDEALLHAVQPFAGGA